MKLGPGADAESSVQVSPDGKTVLACTHGGFTQPSPLWASVDGGASWRRIEPQPDQPFNGDCDIAIGPDGAWAIVYDTVASATVAYSTDQGKTWSLHYVTGLPIGGLDRPWIEAVGGGKLYLSYHSVGTGAPSVDTFAVSTDGGLTWVQKPYALPEEPERDTTVPGDIVVSPDGAIRLPLARNSQDHARNYGDIAVSHDGGTTWSFEHAASAVPKMDGIPALARGGDGTLYFSYSATTDMKGDVMVVASNDDGTTWTAPTVVAANQSFAGLVPTVWVAAGPHGEGTLAWMDAVGEGSNATWQPMLARVHAAGGAVVVDRITPYGTAGRPAPASLYEFHMVRADGAGKLHASYPMNTGADCKQTPAFPSQVGSGSIPRNSLCLYYWSGTV